LATDEHRCTQIRCDENCCRLNFSGWGFVWSEFGGEGRRGIACGVALTTYELAQAKDGYQVVFSFGELDASMGNEKIVVADRQNGNPIPLCLICPDDKVGARSVKMLSTLEVVRLRK